MLKLFENITPPLNDYERETLLPMVMKGLSMHQGKEKAITSDQIVGSMCKRGHKITGVRLRKIVNHIRKNGLLFCVMGDASGYYVSQDPTDIKNQIESLRGREAAIRVIREKMEQQLISIR